MGLAFVACSLLVACGDDETTEDGGTTIDGKVYYTVTTTVNPADAGTVTGAGKYEKGATATLKASANAGYIFSSWEDGSTNNPRLVTVSGNMECVATFVEESSQTGINVTVGSENYIPTYINCQMASNGIKILFGKNASNQYPIGSILYTNEGGIANGTYNGAPSMTVNDDNTVSIGFGNPYVWYFENGSWDLQGNNGTIQTGDWWGKTVVLKIEALDMTNLTASVTVNSELAHVTEMVNAEGYLTTVDFNDVTSKSFTLTAVNQQFEAPSKAIKAPKMAVAKFAK